MGFTYQAPKIRLHVHQPNRIQAMNRFQLRNILELKSIYDLIPLIPV